jgi:hypothetical protein
MGVKQSSSDLLINNCDEFIFYEDLVRPTTSVPVVDPQLHHLSPKKAEAIRLVLETFQALQREGKEVIYGSMIKQTLIRKLPSFNESYYGYAMFSRLLEDAAESKLLKLAKDQKSGGYIVTQASEASAGAPSLLPAETTATGQAAESSAGANGSAAGTPAPTGFEPRDRFRRSRWERGRVYRGDRYAGSQRARGAPLPATVPSQPTVDIAETPEPPPAVESLQPLPERSSPAIEPAMSQPPAVEPLPNPDQVATPDSEELSAPSEVEVSERSAEDSHSRGRRSRQVRKTAASNSEAKASASEHASDEASARESSSSLQVAHTSDRGDSQREPVETSPNSVVSSAEKKRKANRGRRSSRSSKAGTRKGKSH